MFNIKQLYIGSLELGIYTFVENTPDAETGKTLHPAQRLKI